MLCDGVVKWQMRFSARKCTWEKTILIFHIKTKGTESCITAGERSSNYKISLYTNACSKHMSRQKKIKATRLLGIIRKGIENKP